MKIETLEKIKCFAKINSVTNLTDEEIEKMVNETESILGVQLSGYVLKDKPYQRYFSKEINEKKYYNDKRVGVKAYEEACQAGNKTAFIIGNTEISFSDFAAGIKDAAERLKKMGIKKGDNITIACLSTIEILYVFFGASIIGAVVRLLDPISSSKVIIDTIRDTDSKLFITNDLNYLKLQKDLSCINIKKLCLPIDEVLKGNKSKEATIVKLISKLSRLAIKFSSKNWMSYFDFCKISVESNSIDEIKEDYIPNETFAIFSTSGSTGKAKGVCVTDDAIIISILKQMDANFDFTDDELVYNPMPSNSSYFWDDILLAICYHYPTKLDPLFSLDRAAKTILNSKSSIVLSGPIIIEKLIEHINSLDESALIDVNIRHLVSGGDILSPDLELKANESLKKINPNLVVENAYGTSETIGPAFVPNGVMKDKSSHAIGSTGVLLPGDYYGIFEYDKENNLRNIESENYNSGLMYYEIGEICFSIENSTIFKEYYQDQESTTAAKITHTDGTVWYHTGDLGYIDPAGHHFTCGRKSGLIVRAGHKVWAPKIVNLILNYDEVNDCSVIGVPDVNEKEIPCAFISFKDGISEECKNSIINRIKNDILINLDDMHIPSYFWIVDNIPRNLMMKAKIDDLLSLHYEIVSEDIDNSDSKVFILLKKTKNI